MSKPKEATAEGQKNHIWLQSQRLQTPASERIVARHDSLEKIMSSRTHSPREPHLVLSLVTLPFAVIGRSNSDSYDL